MTAEKFYLSAIKTLPFYPFKLYRSIESNGHQVCVGLSAKGLYLMEDNRLDSFQKPDLLGEYLWAEVRYCTRKKYKVRLGVFSNTKMDELILKVRGPDPSTMAERLFKDATRLRDGLLNHASPHSRMAGRMHGAVRTEAPRRTSKIGPSRKISDFTLSLENSFKKLRERSWTGASSSDFQV